MWKITLITVLFILLISGLTAQNFEPVDFRVVIGESNLENPWTGGLNSPHFSQLDMNLDGLDDLVAFERDGEVFVPFLADSNGGEIHYTFAPKYRTAFPKLKDWALIRDYDGDEVPDIFTASTIGVAGIQVYKGYRTDDSLFFEIVELIQPYPNVLAYRSGSNYVNVEVSTIDLPAIRDINGDGDLDILSFTGSGGAVVYYENQQVEEGLSFDEIYFRLDDVCWGKFYESDFDETINLGPSPNECADQANGAENRLHSGSTLEVLDADYDGDQELLLGDLLSDNMVFLENGGSPGEAYMTSFDPLFPSYDIPVDQPTFLVPAYLDVDLDGRHDLMVTPNTTSGEADKYDQVSWYRNIGPDGRDSFEFQRNDFLVGDMIDVGSASVPAVIDVNADGLMDIIVGAEVNRSNGVFTEEGVFLWMNVGEADSPVFELMDRDYLGFSSFVESSLSFAPAMGDVDGDMDIDLVIGDATGQLFFVENTGGIGNAVIWEQPVYPWFDIDVGQYAYPAIVDVNSDGLSDLVVGERTGNNNNDGRCGNVNYFENQGVVGAPSFDSDEAMAPNDACFGHIMTVPTGGTRGFSAPFVYQGATRNIFLVGGYEGVIHEYDLDSEADTLERLRDNLSLINDGQRSACVLADLDNDNVLELICGNERGGLTLRQSDYLTNGQTPVRDPDDKMLEIEVFPNPVGNGSFTYRAPLEPKLLCMIDILGRAVVTVQNPSSSGRIVTGELTPGIYYIIFEFDDTRQVKKVVVE